MSEIIICNAFNENLIDVIENLASSIWHEFYTPDLGKEPVNYMLNMFQSREAIKNQLNGGFKYYLIKDKDNYLGYFGIDLREDHCFLSKLYIRQEHRRKGLGRQAVQLVEALANENELPKILLKVYINNPGGIQAYKKLGFNIVKPVFQDIGNDIILDDFLMEKKLSENHSIPVKSEEICSLP